MKYGNSSAVDHKMKPAMKKNQKEDSSEIKTLHVQNHRKLWENAMSKHSEILQEDGYDEAKRFEKLVLNPLKGEAKLIDEIDKIIIEDALNIEVDIVELSEEDAKKYKHQAENHPLR